VKERILVVDDVSEFLELISMTLVRENYEVRKASSGAEALSIVRTWQPDLVILDVMMPIMDGYEVIQRLRDFEGTADVPVIMLTALKGLPEENKGFSSGAVDYISKPFNRDVLLMRVKAQLQFNKRIKQRNVYIPDRVIDLPLVLTTPNSGIFRTTYRVTKRLFDLTVGVMLLPIAIPILLLTALAVRLDSPGPIVFVQERTGSNGKRFKMYKFRTMVQNAEELKEKYRHLNEQTWPDFKITNDPRVTRVGKKLRKTSLDELPQLLNIIMGTMSIVGPRPTSFKPETYELWHTERLEVTPGLTGLWQVTGRADVDFDERVEMDIEYIERQSWAFDLQIIWATVSAVFTGRGAH
jgi:lipopolysaccharide/colanic/teichoic acid biosynthesis glycosyltransferase/FixJ family two-component response regulator